jgi:hypothetical protein
VTSSPFIPTPSHEYPSVGDHAADRLSRGQRDLLNDLIASDAENSQICLHKITTERSVFESSSLEFWKPLASDCCGPCETCRVESCVAAMRRSHFCL